jgi:hypothetical protein
MHIRRGPYNLGTTCFAGSTLTCLYSIQCLMNYIISHDTGMPGMCSTRSCNLCLVHSFYFDLESGRLSDDTACGTLESFYTHFFSGDLTECHDPIEFFQSFYAKLPQHFQNHFCFACIKTTKPCSHCNRVRSPTPQDIMNTCFINCCVKSSIANALAGRFVATQRLVKCCKGIDNVSETHQDQLIYPPHVLLVVLNRSPYAGPDFDMEVIVDEHVDLRSYLHGTQADSGASPRLHYKAMGIIYRGDNSKYATHFTSHCRRRHDMLVWDYHDDNSPTYDTSIPVGLPDTSLTPLKKQWLRRLRKRVYIVIYEAVCHADVSAARELAYRTQHGPGSSEGDVIELISDSEPVVDSVAIIAQGSAKRRREDAPLAVLPVPSEETRILELSRSSDSDSGNLTTPILGLSVLPLVRLASLIVAGLQPIADMTTLSSFQRLLGLPGSCVDWTREAPEDWERSHYDVLPVLQEKSVFAKPPDTCNVLASAVSGVTFVALVKPLDSDDNDNDDDAVASMRVLVLTSKGELDVWLCPSKNQPLCSSARQHFFEAARCYVDCVLKSETCPIIDIECEYRGAVGSASGTAVPFEVFLHAHSVGPEPGPPTVGLEVSACGGSACSECSPTGGACSCPQAL